MTKGKIIALVVAVCALVTGGVFAFQAQGRSADYERARELAQSGNTQEAYAQFLALGNYSDASAQAQALVAADPALPYRAAERGALVQFGTWEQDGDVQNGAEPLSWIVLDRVDDRVLLLSESCIDGRAYNPAAFTSVTWETCELRSWLNGDFLNTALTDAERALVPEVENVNEDRLGAEDEDDPMQEVFADGGNGTEQMGVGGNNTRDRVFLLSETEARIYLYDEVSKETVGKARVVEAAAARGVLEAEDGSVGWWLRSPGVYAFTAQYVDETGAPYPSGAYVELVYGVRPALWVSTQSATDGASGEGEATA